MNAVCAVAALNPWLALLVSLFLVGAIWQLAVEWTRFYEGFPK